MPSQIITKKQDESIMKQDTQKLIISHIQQKTALDFDRDKFPPNMEDARKHGRAARCATEVHGGPQDICSCCGLNAYNEQLVVCDDRKKLSFLGTGFPLFFDFVLWSKRILILAFVIFGLYAILSNAAGGDCINALNTVQGELKDACCSVNKFGNTECSKTKIIDEFFCNNLIENQISGLEHVCASSEGILDLQECCQQTCRQNDQRCHQVGTHSICLPNKQNHKYLRMVQSIILICFVIIFKIIMVIMRRQQRQTELDCDLSKVNPSIFQLIYDQGDFTAIIRNLPSNEYDEQSLKLAILGYCETLNPSIHVEIIRIILSYEVYEYIEIVRRLNHHNLEIEKAKYYFKNKGKYPRQINEKQFLFYQQQISILNEKKLLLDQQIIENKFKKPSTIAFVTFRSKNELDQLLFKSQISPLNYYFQQFLHIIRLNKLQQGFLFKGNLLSFERAPEPDDVFWENCGIPEYVKVWRRFITHFMALFVLIMSFGFVLVLKYAQLQMVFQTVTDKFSNQGEIQSNVVTALSVIISLFIVTFNKILAMVIENYSLKEYHTTRTNYQIKTAKQMIFFQFVNSTLLIIGANVLMNTIYFSQFNSTPPNQAYINRIAFERDGGVVDDFFSFAIQNFFGPPLITYLNVRNCFKVVKKWKIRGRQDAHKCLTTQAEANKIFEGNQIDLVGYYGHVMISVWVTFFYASLVPVALIISFFGLIFFYWVQKYLLTQVYTRPFPIGNALNRSMLDMLQYSTILMALGSIWFDYIFNQESWQVIHILNFIALGISLTEFVFNGDWLLRIIFYNKPSKFPRQETFAASQQDLITDYDRLNPITKESALESYLEKFYNIQKDDHTSQEQKIITGLIKYSKNGGMANHNFNLTHFLWTQEIQKYNKYNQQTSEKQIYFTTDICNFVQSQGLINMEYQSKENIQKIELQPLKNYNSISSHINQNQNQ